MNVIELPKFYSDVAELEGIEVIQGQGYKDKPHYSKKEQVMCAIDGKVVVHMVPHINRQEIYAGKRLNESEYDERMYGAQMDDQD